MKYLLAAVQGDIQSVVRCLDEGVDVDVQGEGGVTALMLACMKGHLALVHCLHSAGAVLDKQNGDGWTAFMLVRRVL